MGLDVEFSRESLRQGMADVNRMAADLGLPAPFSAVDVDATVDQVLADCPLLAEQVQRLAAGSGRPPRVHVIASRMYQVDLWRREHRLRSAAVVAVLPGHEFRLRGVNPLFAVQLPTLGQTRTLGQSRDLGLALEYLERDNRLVWCTGPQLLVIAALWHNHSLEATGE